MFYDVSTWYISVGAVAMAVLISTIANAHLLDAMRRVEGKVRWFRDLAPLRDAINFNKRLAWAYISLWLILILVLVLAVTVGLTPFRGAVGHVFAFGVLTLPSSLWTKQVEKKFKGMPVESDDPVVATTFRRYLLDWGKPSLAIPE